MTHATNTIHVPAERLRRFVAVCMEQVGATRDDATAVAEVLVAANLRGVDSHGVARLRRYVKGIRNGTIAAQPSIIILREGPATAAIDAGNGLGQPAAMAAMRLAIAKAEQIGLAMVVVCRANHFGIAGYYAMLALEHGMIGMVTSNASPQVAPTFAAEPMYGTNPIAIAIPSGGPCPYVLDMATSTAARGRMEQMQREGKSIPPGWAIDAQGQTTTDPGTLISGLMGRQGHALMPMGGAGETLGGHKGYGLGLFADLLCGPLAGGGWGRHVYGPAGANLGHTFLAMRVDCFRPRAEFMAESEQLLREIRDAKKMPGQERIYIPGEKEAEETIRRTRDGIPLLPVVMSDLATIAEEIGVPAL
jgi:LDH2 family malate/lactate/ureidoglycolate dehydrogenase